MFDVLGVLPIAMLVLGFIVWRLLLLIFAEAHHTERAAGAVVLAMAVLHLSVWSLAQLGVLSRLSLLALMTLAAVGLWWVSRGRAPLSVLRPTWATGLPLLVIGVVVILAAATARIVPIWQWDSIGYHLPFVQFVVQAGGFSGVPRDVAYLSTYPHNIELAMVWLQLMLPDDRLIDVAQIPYGVGGAVLISCIARRLQASPPAAARARQRHRAGDDVVAGG